MKTWLEPGPATKSATRRGRNDSESATARPIAQPSYANPRYCLSIDSRRPMMAWTGVPSRPTRRPSMNVFPTRSSWFSWSTPAACHPGFPAIWVSLGSGMNRRTRIGPSRLDTIHLTRIGNAARLAPRASISPRSASRSSPVFSDPASLRRVTGGGPGPAAVSAGPLLIHQPGSKRWSAPVGTMAVRSPSAWERCMEEAVERAVAVMRSRYPERLSVADLAAEAFFSPFYFSRIFRRELGVSPVQYLTAVRLFEAKRLLQGTSLNVADIACRVGYFGIGT